MRRIIFFALCIPVFSYGQTCISDHWEHISTINGDIDIPFQGNQQPSCLVLDVDNDGVQEIFITERTQSPSIIMYKLNRKHWESYIICQEKLRLEAGGDSWDIDSDGDKDIVFGGGGSSNQIWWWENPGGNYQRNTPWGMHTIKNDGGKKHHDLMFGDFTGDGIIELVFWNQKAGLLCLADIPDHPRQADKWEYRTIYRYSGDSQMEQIGQLDYPKFKAINDHEGLAKADIDGDGTDDIIGGGSWFKYIGDGQFQENIIDASYTFTRAGAGQIIQGGRPEVILVVGDGLGPLRLYEWKEGTWYGKSLIEEIENGHSLAIIDYNQDGFLDIFNAEMRLNGENPEAKMRVLLGDGKGNFEDIIISTGFGNHESKITDLDGDGDFDIVGKPYNWDTPRLDILINKN